MPMATVNGVDLYYEASGDGRVILGIHGTPSSALLWEDAARELATRGRCVIYDRRGFHRSAGSLDRLDLEQHLDDAVALIDALGHGPASVIGRSTGGQIALALAHRFPDRVRALALLEPAVFAVDPGADAWAQELRSTVLAAATDDPGSASAAVIRSALGDETWVAFPAELREHFDTLSPGVVAEIRGDGLDLSEHPWAPSPDALARLDVPTLVVSAEDSPEALRVVAERLAGALPNAEHVRVDGGHLINPAHPAVLAFLDRT
jgi:pimeloyl-ACP methyl ester carboxylesterase